MAAAEVRTSNNNHHKRNNTDMPEKEELMKKLPKRLVYVLRYGALKEGLEVDDHGYVDVEELPSVGLLKDYSVEEILNDLITSTSYRQNKRYDIKEAGGKTYARAAYLRNLEKSPFHVGTKVNTLFECSMTYILDNLDDYDLEDFPDEFIIRMMIRRLKRQKRLSTKALKALLVPTVTRLDLEGVYLTNNVLKAVWTQCPNLMAVSLKDCGYIITDNVLTQFAKNLPHLERLNLCSCSHLTAKCLPVLAKRLPLLNTLHIARVPLLTYQSVLDFMKTAQSLKFLDVFYLKVTRPEYDDLISIAKSKEIDLVLKVPREKRKNDETKDDKSSDSTPNGESEDVPFPDIDNALQLDYAMACNYFDAADEWS